MVWRCVVAGNSSGDYCRIILGVSDGIQSAGNGLGSDRTIIVFGKYCQSGDLLSAQVQGKEKIVIKG